ncbi:MAG TPA: glycosyltransferase [Candidatus Saccharimonadales bacterium]|nr:glycosyltransferase [Candidatus Saccharimonadales bacterium]
MTWALILLSAISLVELTVWLKPFWAYRKWSASIILILLSIFSGMLIGSKLNIWAVLIGFASLYRVVNLLRLVEGRTPAVYLRKVSRRTSLKLIGFQLALGACWWALSSSGVTTKVYITIITSISLCALALLSLSLQKNSRRANIKTNHLHYAAKDLPSISVLIPARNETEDLEICLSSLVACKYPKLEILVLDDCSQNKRTPEIIKGFAQAGVRFIAGKMPPESWLAKNYAYQQLADQASGDILIFAGVDTRFSELSLNYLIETMLDKKILMASIMPLNIYKGKHGSLRYLFQPVRYAWELALPRLFSNRRPLLSTCWIIYKERLYAYGDFKAVSRSINPELYFANKAAETNKYGFLRTNKDIGVVSEKSISEQRATAIRTRYPKLHRRIELVLAYSITELLIFIFPLFAFIWSMLEADYIVLSLSLLIVILTSLMYEYICRITYSRFSFGSLFIWPAVAITDVLVLNSSMWQYEFSEVLWKGRNVCLPVMQFSPLDQESRH